MNHTPYKSGQEAEALACRYLRTQGYKIIARNWRSPFGEIDIIAREGGTLVFVEVRARGGSSFGGAEGSLTYKKRKRIIATAQAYLNQTATQLPLRFDFVAFADGRVILYRDAFQIEEQWFRNC
jgi:putative endonuclease